MTIPANQSDGKNAHEENGKPPRPTVLPVRLDDIPDELRALDQWVHWRQQFREGKWTKVPFNPSTFKPASSTKRMTWAAFKVAVRMLAQLQGSIDGIGVVFHADDPFLGVDLDNALDGHGHLKDWACPIVTLLASYTEISPSGKGLKIWVKAKKPGDKCRVKRGDGQVEIYDAARYFTVTGHRWTDSPATVEARQPEIDGLYEDLFGGPKVARDPKVARKPPPRSNPCLADEELIEKARQAKNGDKFRRLFDHGDLSDYGNDDSRADLALCDLLAFFARTPERIDGLFRQSALMREKWDRTDYRERTIRKALEGKTDFYEQRNGWHKKSDRQQPAGEQGQAPATPEAGEDNATAGKDRFALGPLVLQPGKPRQTASGKITLPVNVTRGGAIVFPFVLTSAASGRKEPARILSQLLGDDPAKDKIDEVLTAVLAQAASRLTSKVTPSGPTVREIVAGKVPEALQLKCRSERGIWSEAQGEEIRRCDLIAYTPPWLIDECSSAADAPQDAGGQAVRPDLIRLIQIELGVVWADMLSTLPLASDVDLGRDTARGREFREALIRLWKVPVTWEKQQTTQGDTATRASLASRVVSARLRAQSEQTGRDKWQQIHPATDAWWRNWIDGEGEQHTLLAMRYTLASQVGIDLPGVVSEPTLTRLGAKFGVLQEPPEGVPTRLSGGKQRVAMLSLDLCCELLQTLNEDPEDNPRDPGV